MRDDERRRRRDPEGDRHRRRLRLGGRPAARDALERDPHLRGARQGLHEAAPAACARTCAAPTPASPPTRRSSTCARSASPRSSCCRCTTSPTSTSWSTRGSPTTGATARSASSRRTPTTPRPAARGEQVREFKGMVKALHRAGIEVILDVVYNHTAEGNHLGPMLSFKGIDNLSYYRCSPDDPRYYMDFTGTGNSLNPVHPSVLRLIMDSLRYWVLEMHVDGFRFDLASALAREFYDVDRLSAFFDIIHQDPILSQVKLIAEPWDVGPGGYQVGNFPVLWTEWNGIYRDDDARLLARPERRRGRVRLALHRLERPLPVRRPAAVRLDQLHHRATTASRCATSSPTTTSTTRPTSRTTATAPTTTAAGTAASRARPTTRRSSRCASASSATSWPRCCSRRACRCCSAATRSAAPSSGNNNAYCQDNEISWFDWDLDERRTRAARLHPRLIALRRAHPVFHRRDVPRRQPTATGSGLPDICWFRADGREMSGRDWRRSDLRAPRRLPQRRGDPQPRTARGEPIVDDSFVMLVNAGHEDALFRLPAAPLRQPLAPGDLDRRARRARGLAQLAGAHGGDARGPLACCSCAATW